MRSLSDGMAAARRQAVQPAACVDFAILLTTGGSHIGSTVFPDFAPWPRRKMRCGPCLSTAAAHKTRAILINSDAGRSEQKGDREHLLTGGDFHDFDGWRST